MEPLKTLAAMLGLIRYGRNNLAYAEGMGSYLQLFGFATEAILPPTPCREPELLPACSGCRRCHQACPTKVFGEDRFRVQAAGCLTHFNEHEGPWPPGLSFHAHHCLIGCLHCQRVCPANPPLVVVEDALHFTAEETAAILAADGSWKPPGREFEQKLALLGPTRVWNLLGRNLRALLNRQPGATASPPFEGA